MIPSLPAEALPCPSCRQAMVALCLEARPVGHLALDYCAACRGIWFDDYESTRLAPTGVLELFRIIHETQDAPQRTIDILNCPRCAAKLIETRDIVRSGPFAYHRCPNRHGRFTPFAQFLTEKGFVRHLAKKEIEAVCAGIAQISCHACGAPIDLRVDTACPHCHSPIAVLDAEATTKAFREYGEATGQRIREITGDLGVAAREARFLPTRRCSSLLELGVGALVDLF
jgi:Zn-finger nucleic acid-binding protein